MKLKIKTYLYIYNKHNINDRDSQISVFSIIEVKIYEVVHYVHNSERITDCIELQLYIINAHYDR